MISLESLKCVDNNIDVEEYITFREEIKKHMDYPEWLGDFTKEEIIDMLDNGSKIWNYYLNDILICSMMLIPATEKSTMKLELQYDYKDVVDYGPMMVNVNYVGNKLQYQMLKSLDNYCILKGYKYAAGTIHPDNSYSIKNLEDDDFKKIGRKEFSRGIRNIYIKHLIK